jgi:aminoglycoside 6'-N-acetyltransferase
MEMTDESLTLRPATPADETLLLAWQREPHVLAAGAGGDWGWAAELPRQLDWREQLIGELDGRPFAFVQIIDPAREESHYWGDCGPQLRAIDIWIGPAELLGRGWGTQLMQRALARCFADATVAAVIIDPLFSNRRARRFYERLGFRFVERRMFDDDDTAVYRLTRADWAAGPVGSRNDTTVFNGK